MLCGALGCVLVVGVGNVVRVVVVVVAVVVVGVVGVVVALRQSRVASWASFVASWVRLSRSVALSEGKLDTLLLNELTALIAPLQLPEATAEETWSSWLLSVLA